MENQKYNKKFMLGLVILTICTAIANLWVIGDGNTFLFDDYSWLHTAMTKDYREIFTLFPTSKYNDRPMGAMLIKILYDTYGLDYTKHHIVLLTIHLINTVMVVFFSREILKICNKGENSVYALIAGAIFGMYPKSIMCVQWEAAIFDLLGATFSLVAILLYLQYRRNNSYKYFYMVLSIIAYYLGLRTKEMVVTLPIIIVCIEFLSVYNTGRKIKDIFSNLYIRVAAVIMIAYTICLFWLPSVDNITNTSDNPYYLDFNPINILYSLFKYVAIYFDLVDSSFTYNGLNVVNIIGIIGIICIIALAVYSFVKRKKIDLIVLIVCIGFSIVPVLPMINMQHVLYLYIPSIFVGILFMLAVLQIAERIKIRGEGLIISLIIMTIIYCTHLAPGVQNARNYWSSLCAIDAQAISDIEKIEKPTVGTNIYIQGANLAEYSVFYYGPGAINNLIFQDASLVTHMELEENTEKITPFVIWHYDNGHVSQIAENQEYEIEITGVFPDKISKTEFNTQENGKSAIAIQGINFNEQCKIVMDSVELETVYSPEFISAIVEEEYIKDKEQVTVYVKDYRHNVESEKVILEIDNDTE